MTSFIDEMEKRKKVYLTNEDVRLIIKNRLSSIKQSVDAIMEERDRIYRFVNEINKVLDG